MSGNYPDDYNPFLPGGPDWEPWKGRTCKECNHSRTLDDFDGSDIGYVCIDYECTGRCRRIDAHQPALECFED